jgi:hypothetical protein
MIPKPLSESQLALLRQVHYGTRELLKAEMGRGAPKMFDPLRQRGQPIDPNTFERFGGLQALAPFSAVRQPVAVGTPVTGRPPRRSRYVEFHVTGCMSSRWLC